ncbi:hypothetical protein [Streptomyces buecherae]|uniref:hypothetical protein n=1 Tax=Streptomyces buecherae TaxID=2763006 RepID=UPI0037ACA40A
MSDTRRACAALAMAAAAVLFAGSSAVADGHTTSAPTSGHVTGIQAHDSDTPPAIPLDGHAS